MTTLPIVLSPERCHQLREGGILRLLVNLLNQHTFESQDKPEAQFNMESFLEDFDRKSQLRSRLSDQIRIIVENTAKNEDELSILDLLAALRLYVELLYGIIDDWKTITKDENTLNKRTDVHTELAVILKEIIEQLKALTADDTIRSIFEQFGGVFVIVDYLRAQTRFNTKVHQFEWGPLDASQILGVAKDSKIVLRGAVVILSNMVVNLSDDIRLFLGDCRSLHEIMVGVVENAYSDGDLLSVKWYCYLIERLYHTDDLCGHAPPGVMPSTSHLKDCGVIKCLTKFGMKTNEPETLSRVIMALEAPLALLRPNVLEFVSIDGSANMLIDVLVPSKEKDKDVENAEWYEKLRRYSFSILFFLNGLSPQNRIDGRLLTIYESRDMAAILVRDLELITSINDDSLTTWHILHLLREIVEDSEDQRRRFTGIVNGKEVVKRFESSDDEFVAQISKLIGEMFE